jgi:hypothetical protein
MSELDPDTARLIDEKSGQTDEDEHPQAPDVL